LKASGFVNIDEQYQRYSWNFPDLDALIKYCHQLFGLVKADLSEVEVELRKYFAIEVDSNSVKLPWSAVYAVGVKSTQP